MEDVKLTQSLWLDTGYPRDKFPQAHGRIRCDVCIVGGGLSGIAAAEQLAAAGKDVVLVERDRILAGTTGNSTGKLTAQHGYVYADLLKQFGKDGARTYFEANEEAVRRGRDIAGEGEARPSDSYIFSQTRHGTEKLRREWDAYREIGIQGSFGKETELPFPVQASLSMVDELQIHPFRFGQRLARMAADHGARIYEMTAVRTMDFKKRTVSLSTGGMVEFKELVLATHYPIRGFRGLNIIKLAVNRSYISVAPTDRELKDQYISVDSPQRSIRTANIDGKIYMMLAGSNHTAGMKKETDEEYGRLAEDLENLFHLKGITHSWSAQDPQTPDLVPYVGQISDSLPHVYIATGFRKWGLSNSLAGSKILRDLITGRENAATKLYDPGRTGFGALLLQGLKINGLVAGELATGYTVRLDSPTCTHMGCKTQWNEGDRTWDCPCHGSRFREDGSVLEGPATKPLDLS